MAISQEQLDRLVQQVFGEDVVRLVRALIKGKENVSEFLLAEQIDFPINYVRNMLYKLQDANLVNSMRKKDRKKGWYIYYWTFNPIEAEGLMNKLQNERISTLKRRIEKESDNQYFTCQRKCLRLTLPNALEAGFQCPECTKALKEVNNAKNVNLLRKELEILQSEKQAVEA